jgi:hypothetical protein
VLDRAALLVAQVTRPMLARLAAEGKFVYTAAEGKFVYTAAGAPHYHHLHSAGSGWSSHPQ